MNRITSGSGCVFHPSKAHGSLAASCVSLNALISGIRHSESRLCGRRRDGVDVSAVFGYGQFLLSRIPSDNVSLTAFLEPCVGFHTQSGGFHRSQNPYGQNIAVLVEANISSEA